LADFEAHLEEFQALDARVVAASVDDHELAAKTVARHQITYPVACGLSAPRMAELTGAFWDEEKGYLHATGFLLRPDGNVAGAVYSTGPVGRYVAADVLGMIRYLSKT